MVKWTLAALHQNVNQPTWWRHWIPRSHSMGYCLDTHQVPSPSLGRHWSSIQTWYAKGFRDTIDLVEMVFATWDPGISALYGKLLVSRDLWSFGKHLESNSKQTKSLLIQVTYSGKLLPVLLYWKFLALLWSSKGTPTKFDMQK